MRCSRMTVSPTASWRRQAPREHLPQLIPGVGVEVGRPDAVARLDCCGQLADRGGEHARHDRWQREHWQPAAPPVASSGVRLPPRPGLVARPGVTQGLAVGETVILLTPPLGSFPVVKPI